MSEKFFKSIFKGLHVSSNNNSRETNMKNPIIVLNCIGHIYSTSDVNSTIRLFRKSRLERIVTVEGASEPRSEGIMSAGGATKWRLKNVVSLKLEHLKE